MAQEGNPLLLSHELLSLLDKSDTDQLPGDDVCVEPLTDSQCESPSNLDGNSCVNASAKRSLEQSSPAHSHEQEPPKKPKRVRRQRQELLYLRDKAKELETQLNELKTINTSLHPMVHGGHIKEYNLRAEAERENRRLRDMLQKQVSTATSLLNGLYQPNGHGSKLPPLSFDGSNQADNKNGIIANELDASKDSTAFERLFTVLNETYENIDSITDRVNASGIVGSGPQKRVRVLPHAKDNVRLQMNMSNVVPFNLDVTTKVFWKLCMDIGFLQHCYCVELSDCHPTVHSFSNKWESDGDYYCQKFALRADEKAGSIHAVGRRAIRCYVEAKRVVFIFAAEVRPTESSNAHMDGLTMMNQAAVILEDEGVVGSPSTRIKVDMVAQPHVDGLFGPNKRKRVGEVTDLILSAHGKKEASMEHVIKSTLVQEDLERFMEQ